LTSASLAYAEMYLMVAAIARQFNLKLDQTTLENVRFGRDMTLPYPKQGGFSVKVTVTGVVN
jgi:hypothetical protein